MTQMPFTDASLAGIVPDWTVAPNVRAWVSTRAGGISTGAFGDEIGHEGGLNLGEHVGDDPIAVRANRERVQSMLPGQIVWLSQVHGTDVFDADVQSHSSEASAASPQADAAVTTHPARVLSIMSADCLPILLADEQGRGVGIAHAGWRGLASGVVEATVDEMRARLGGDSSIQAWLGPAIGPNAFEVGQDVYAAFCDQDAFMQAAFRPGPQPGKWWADLYHLARRRLKLAGVDQVSGGGLCTFSDPARFYSHRRDRRTGRMVSLIWLLP